jgi:LacI family transcriptional regulator
MSARVGIRQVAQHAGVAAGTVSNYLNHPERVSQDKADRVRQAIEELGFVPNSVGRQLRLGESNAIAYIAPDISNPFFSTTAEGVEQRARELGLAVFVANTHRDPARENDYLQLFERYRVRGLLVASYEVIEDRLAELRRRGTRTVLLGQHSLSDSQPSVSVDEVMGGRLAGEHLLSLGHRRIAFVGGPLTVPQVLGRLQGVCAAARDCGGATVEVVETDDRTIAVGREVGRALAARPEAARPEAVFAVNDLIAIGVVAELTAMGRRVPEDVALIGYDDTAYAAHSLIPLSSIRTPHEGFGSVAVDVLMDNLEHGQVRHELFTPELAARASTVGR